MLITVHMKTPDALDRAISDVIHDRDIDDDKEAILAICEKWFSYGECVTIVIDTVAKTATVREN